MIISGSIRDAFTHCAGLGLALIAQEESGSTTFYHWIDQNNLEVTAGNMDDDTLSALVKEHAIRQSQSEWLNHIELYDENGKQKERSPLSPRIGKLSEDDFRKTVKARADSVDSLKDAEPLVQHLFGALGEPSYWSRNEKGEFFPDYGASCWEMKTRNHGDDFVRCRLLRLAQSVAARDAAAIKTGLLGITNEDEVGKNALDSHTPTGLRRAGRVDNARAWCALWGLSVFPTRPVVRMNHPTPSNSAGAVREKGVFFIVPIIQSEVTIGRYQSVTRSAALHRYGASVINMRYKGGQYPVQYSYAQRKADRNWLSSHQSMGVIMFQRAVGGSANAPEYWAEEGEVDLF